MQSDVNGRGITPGSLSGRAGGGCSDGIVTPALSATGVATVGASSGHHLDSRDRGQAGGGGGADRHVPSTYPGELRLKCKAYPLAGIRYNIKSCLSERPWREGVEAN